MTTTPRAWVLTAAVLLLTTACADATTEAASPVTVTVTETAEVTVEPDLGNPEDVEEYEDVEGEVSDSGLFAIPLGETYEYERFYVDADPTLEAMTVRAVECGIDEIPEGLYNPDWDGGDDIPQYMTLEADAGMAFCRIDATVQNVGDRSMVGWTDFGDLIIDGQVFAADTAADEATSNRNECSPYLCETINPATPAFDVEKYYHVPEGSEPAAVQYPFPTMETGPEVEFVLD